MSKLKPKNRELDLTIYEDLSHLRELWDNPNLSNKDIRLSSQIVRRLLLQGDLSKCAYSHGISLLFLAPDNKPLVRASQNGHMVFFQSHGVKVFGVDFRGLMVTKSNHYVDIEPSWNPETTVELKLDGFLSQPVFYFPAVFSKEGKISYLLDESKQAQFKKDEIAGTLITRKDVINYVANKAGGPHFDTNRFDTFACLDHIRSAAKYTSDNGTPGFRLNFDAFRLPSNDFTFTPTSIDSVFLELVATCKFLTQSPRIQQLMNSIRADLHV